MRRALPALLALAAALASLGCGSASLGRAQQELAAGDLEGARTTLERERERDPRSVDVRIALGEVYYRLAREALDRDRNEARYLAYLERSVGEFATAVELDPRDERPHFYLAMMDTYRGDLASALRGFALAKRLRPAGLAYTNLAEIYVYRGDPERAREWNGMGARRGAPYGAVLFNDMLIAWREGDLAEARRCFADLNAAAPEMLRTINEAPVPRPPQRFEDFAAYCCGSPACGPYLEAGCKQLALEVKQRGLSAEAVRKELVIEMEKERRLREVYQQRKDLQLEVEREPAPN